MATIKFECNPSKTNSDGESIIYLRITKGSKRRYISTQISIRPELWNNRRQEVRKFKTKTCNSDELNAELSDLKTKALQKIKETSERASIDLLKEKIIYEDDDTLSIENGKINLLHFGNRENKKIKRSSYNHYKRRQTPLNELEEYTGGAGVMLHEIDRGWIIDFHEWLLERKSTNTANKDTKILGNFFNLAIKAEMTTLRNPFSLVSFKNEPSQKEKLNEKEFNAIRNLDLKEGSLIWHVRNYFCTQVFAAGMRISDLCTLQKKECTGQRTEYQMKKTGQWISVLNTPPLQEMYDTYRAIDPENPNMFPLLPRPVKDYKSDRALVLAIDRKTSLCNKYLKKIKSKAKIQKSLTTHIARHTFADMARKKGWSIYDISKALGHSSIKVTEGYLAQLDTDSLDKNMKEMWG